MLPGRSLPLLGDELCSQTALVGLFTGVGNMLGAAGRQEDDNPPASLRRRIFQPPMTTIQIERTFRQLLSETDCLRVSLGKEEPCFTDRRQLDELAQKFRVKTTIRRCRIFATYPLLPFQIGQAKFVLTMGDVLHLIEDNHNVMGYVIVAPAFVDCLAKKAGSGIAMLASERTALAERLRYSRCNPFELETSVRQAIQKAPKLQVSFKDSSRTCSDPAVLHDLASHFEILTAPPVGLCWSPWRHCHAPVGRFVVATPRDRSAVAPAAPIHG